MSHFRFPKDKKWRGGFPGVNTGEILFTRNVDLARSPGRISLADKIVKYVDTADTNMSNLTLVTKFLRSNADLTDRFWAVCGNGVTGGRLFKSAGATPVGTWAEETEATGDTPPTTVLDFEIHESANGEQRILATLPTDVAILNKSGGANVWDINWGTTVASGGTALTTATLHPIARLQRLIAIGNGNVLVTIDSSDVFTPARLTMPYGYSIRNIYATADRFWIGCTNSIGTSAKIIEWDGASLTYNNEYDVIGDTPLCGFIVHNVPYFITNVGYIYKYSGGSFVVDQQFPIVEDQLITLDISTYGTIVIGDKVNILAKDSSDGAQEESKKFRSGIWEFDVRTRNLNHKHGVGATDIGTMSTTPDFGQSIVHSVGGIISAFTSAGIVLFFGAKVYTAWTTTPGTTTLFGLFRTVQNRERYGSQGYNRGFFVTTQMSIADVSAMWNALWVKFKKFVDSTNRIVVKARVVDPKMLTTADLTGSNSNTVVQASGTWTATTTFTSVVPTGVAVGDEVEVMNGNGAGCTFHISTLSATPDNSATITVTVDEAIPSLNSAGSRGALFRFDNWTKVGAISSTTVGSEKLTIPGSMQGEFLQLKVELRGYEVEVDEFIPVYKSLTNPEQ